MPATARSIPTRTTALASESAGLATPRSPAVLTGWAIEFPAARGAIALIAGPEGPFAARLVAKIAFFAEIAFSTRSIAALETRLAEGALASRLIPRRTGAEGPISTLARAAPLAIVTRAEGPVATGTIALGTRTERPLAAGRVVAVESSKRTIPESLLAARTGPAGTLGTLAVEAAATFFAILTRAAGALFLRQAHHAFHLHGAALAIGDIRALHLQRRVFAQERKITLLRGLATVETARPFFVLDQRVVPNAGAIEIDTGFFRKFRAELVGQHARAHLGGLSFIEIAELERPEGDTDQP
jgi:hypothetical protein